MKYIIVFLLLSDITFAQNKYALILCDKSDADFKQETAFIKAIFRNNDYKILKTNDLSKLVKQTTKINDTDSVVFIYTGHGKENIISKLPDLYVFGKELNSLFFIELLCMQTNNVKFFVHACNKAKEKNKRKYAGIAAKKGFEVEKENKDLFYFIFNLNTKPTMQRDFFEYYNN